MSQGTWSAFKFSCSKRYYLTHPWKWFKDAYNNIRDAYRRARYGWTYADAWNWDTWFLEVAPPMLRHIADHGSAYPGYPPFDGEHGRERWCDWLHEVADLLETGTEDWQDAHNEYYDEYMEHIMEDWQEVYTDENGYIHHKVTKRSEISNKYFERSAELYEQGEKNVRNALSMIAEHFHAIWD